MYLCNIKHIKTVKESNEIWWTQGMSWHQSSMAVDRIAK